MSRVFVLGCVLALGSTVLSADQTPSKSQTKAQFGALRQAQSGNSYRTLFTPPQQAASSPTDPNRTVRCGMTIIEADPMFDSKIAVSPPKDGTHYTIRAVPPPICGAPR